MSGAVTMSKPGSSNVSSFETRSVLRMSCRRSNDVSPTRISSPRNSGAAVGFFCRNLINTGDLHSEEQQCVAH